MAVAFADSAPEIRNVRVTTVGEITRLIGKYQKLGEEDGNRAVEAAHAAFPRWSNTPVQERVRIVLDAAQRLRERKHEFSAMLTFEVGKSWAEADADTAEAIDFLEYYAGQMLRMAEPQPVKSGLSGSPWPQSTVNRGFSGMIVGTLCNSVSHSAQSSMTSPGSMR